MLEPDTRDMLWGVKVTGIITALAFLAITLAVVAVLALWSPAHAQTSPATFCGWPSVALPPTSLITSTTKAIATSSVTNGAITTPSIPTLSQGSIVGCLFTVETATIRVRDDAQSPTAVSGMQYGPGGAGGTVFTACGSSLATGTGANATVMQRWVADTSTAALVTQECYVNGR
jgi:energy-converting hydrogenase Eha subunit A